MELSAIFSLPQVQLGELFASYALWTFCSFFRAVIGFRDGYIEKRNRTSAFLPVSCVVLS